MNNIFKTADWICPVEFKNEKFLNLLSKENCAIKPVLPNNLKNIHMLVKKNFLIKETDKNYTIRITVDDYYKLYINGA